MSTAGNSLENGGSSVRPPVTRDNHNSPKASQINGDKGNAASKKPTKSSLSKPKTRESSTAPKVKHVETEDHNNTQNLEKFQDRPYCAPEPEDLIEEGHVKNSSYSNGSQLASPNSEAMPADVTVEG